MESFNQHSTSLTELRQSQDMSH